MTNHVTDLFVDFLDGTLSTDKAGRVRSHLSSCAACQHALEDTKKNIALLKTQPTGQTFSPDLEERVIARVNAELDRQFVENRKTSIVTGWRALFGGYRGWVLAATGLFAFLIVRNYPRPTIATSPQNEIQETTQSKSTTGEISSTPKPSAMTAMSLPPASPKEEAKKEIMPSEKSLQIQFGKANSNYSQTAPSAPETPSMKRRDALVARSASAPASQILDEKKANTASEMESGAVGAVTADKISMKDQEAFDMDAAKSKPMTAKNIPSNSSWQQGWSSGIRVPTEKVIRDADSWKTLWAEHISGRAFSPTPEINFENQEIVAIFAGECPSAGYRVDVLSTSVLLIEGKQTRVVRYRITAPPQGMVAAMVLTQPYEFLVLPQDGLPIVIQKNP